LHLQRGRVYDRALVAAGIELAQKHEQRRESPASDDQAAVLDDVVNVHVSRCVKLKVSRRFPGKDVKLKPGISNPAAAHCGEKENAAHYECAAVFSTG
jgi:hypothetical protein